MGKDVAQALGYSNTSKAIKMHVDEEDKGTLPNWEGAYATRAIIINESGLYALIKTECLYVATKFNDEARASLGSWARTWHRRWGIAIHPKQLKCMWITKTS